MLWAGRDRAPESKREYRNKAMNWPIVSRVGGPKSFGGFDGFAELGDVSDGALEEVEAGSEPAGEGGLGEVIEDVASFAALFDEAMGAEEAQMLGDTGMGDTENVLEGVDVFFAVAEFLDDTDAMGVGEDTE